MAIMVGILLWHIVKIFTPSQEAQVKHFSSPGSTPPAEIAGFEPVAVPATKPGPDVAAVYTPHPFWYSPSGTPTTTETPAAPEESTATP